MDIFILLIKREKLNFNKNYGCFARKQKRDYSMYKAVLR